METNIIKLDNKHWKKSDVILLPTENITQILKKNDKLLYFSEGNRLGDYINQYLYVLSDEEIKEGDWFIANQGVHKCIRVNENTTCRYITLNNNGEEIGHFKTWKTKIIATTNYELSVGIRSGVKEIDDAIPDLVWHTELPKMPQSFIQEFVKNQGNGYDEILIEVVMRTFITMKKLIIILTSILLFSLYAFLILLWSFLAEKYNLSFWQIVGLAFLNNIIMIIITNFAINKINKP